MSQLSQSDLAVSVQDAQPSDHPGIRAVLLAAYQEYAAMLPPAVFDRYVEDIVDVDARSRVGQLIVAERAGRIVGAVTYYADAAAEGFGWPSGWAGLRALGVDPAVRGRGIGHALMRAGMDRARAAGTAVICLHTAEFMTAAAAMYEAMGFQRVPSFDFDAAGHLRLRGADPIRIAAYRLDLRPDRRRTLHAIEHQEDPSA
jgi:predicted N-acetyltransferase YhbS